MSTKPTKKACPCHSGADYRACCSPYHLRKAQAPDAVSLMRSRYSAFALGDAEYLYDTLGPGHEDRKMDKAALLRDFRTAKSTLRYQGLAILDSTTDGDAARVLLHATIFEKGQDRSFVELSEFVKVDGGWRYESGRLLPTAKLGKSLAGLDIPTFETLSPS